MLKQQLYGDKRCIYCGKWFHWKQEDSHKWLLGKNIDTYNVDDVLEPLHCGSQHCDYYHIKCLEVGFKRRQEDEAEIERNGLKIYMNLRNKGLL